MGGIYLIKCANNETIYVGSAKNFKKRFGEHRRDLENHRHGNPHLQHSYDKYGKDSLEFVEFRILGEYNKDVYFAEENQTMDLLRLEGQKLFNIAKAEGGWTYATQERKDEIAAKISGSLKKTNSKLSEADRREKYGKGKIGIPLSEERKNRLSSFWSGKEKSEETKQRMSQSQKESAHNKEAGRRLGLLNKGRKPPNTRQVKINEIVFSSVKEAAEYFNVSSATIIKRIKRGNSAEYLT